MKITQDFIFRFAVAIPWITVANASGSFTFKIAKYSFKFKKPVLSSVTLLHSEHPNLFRKNLLLRKNEKL